MTGPPVKFALLAGLLASVAALAPSDCTHTIIATIRGPSSPMTWPVVLTMTTHSATKTARTSLDCSGCRFLQIDPTIFGCARPSGQPPTSIEVYTAMTPTTVTQTHCAARSHDATAQVSSKHPGSSGNATSEGRNCTASIFEAPRLTFGPTRTIFTATSTSTRFIDCHSCGHVSPVSMPFGVPPVATFSTTITASEPFVATELACAKSMKSSSSSISSKTAEPSSTPGGPPNTADRPSYWTAPPSLPKTVFPVGIKDPDCTRSIGLAPARPHSTLTIYPSTITQTSGRNCGSCALVWSTATIDYLVPVPYVAIVTKKKPSIVTALDCTS